MQVKAKPFYLSERRNKQHPLISESALACNSYYVNQRWLGGMLTNWQTIQKSIRKLKEYRFAEENGDWNLLKKQEVAKKRREQQRLEKYLGGLENMPGRPDVVIIIGQPEEIHAVRECRQLGIPTITLLDSNCDPTVADWFVPMNDDSVSGLRLILNAFETSINAGQTKFNEASISKRSKTLRIGISFVNKFHILKVSKRNFNKLKE